MSSAENIIDEIAVQLNQYFSQEESRKFYSLLKEAEKTSLDPIRLSAENEAQINKKIESGSNIRDQIDRLLTFAETRVKDDDKIKLYLSIVQLLINYCEFEQAQDITEEIIDKIHDNSILKAEAYLLNSKIFWNQGIWDKSTHLCKKSYTIFTRLNNDEGMAKCENMLGTIFGERGDIEKAEKHFLKGLDYIKYTKNYSLKAMFNSNLGIIANILGKFSEAKTYYVSSLNYYSKLNEPKNVARLNHNVGMLYSKQEQYEIAIKYFNESINLSLEKGYLSNCAISFIGKSYAYSQLGEQALSEKFAEKAFEIAYKINDRLSIADVYRIKGVIYKNLQNNELSEEFFENSIRLNTDFDNNSNIAETSLELSDLYDNSTENIKRDVLMNEVKKYYRKIRAEEILDKIENKDRESRK